MYSAVTNGLGGGGNEGPFQPTTINPQALNQGSLPNPTTAISQNDSSRGIKRSRSPDAYGEMPTGDNLADDGDSKPRKRGRPMKTRPTETPQQSSTPHPTQSVTPQTPQSQGIGLSHQAPIATPTQASPPKPTPTKTVIKALPTVRDHTTDQLGPEGDEYIPREFDDQGEKKVSLMGHLQDGREYKCRTFFVPNRGDKLFMLATECARVLGYRDSYLLFNKNRSLYKIIATQAEKEDLIQQEILPYSYRSRQIAIVTARSMFRQFGSRVIVDGRRVRDDYWESKARKQGFTEEDLAGEKRPGAAKARDAAAAEANANANLALAHGDIVYTNNPNHHYSLHSQPQAVQGGMMAMPVPNPLPMIIAPEQADMRLRDYSNIQRPRQEITGPAYQDRIQNTPISDLHSQAHQTAEYNKHINQQRSRSHDYLDRRWRQPHDPQSSNEGIATTQALQSPRTSQTTTQQTTIAHQGPQHMLNAQPYSQAQHQPGTISQPPIRATSSSSMRPEQISGRSPSLPIAATSTITQSTNPYQFTGQTQIWSSNQSQQSPQQHSFPSYTSNPQQSPHIQQSPHQPPSQLRHSGSNPQMQPGIQYSGMQGMSQSYAAPRTLYAGEQGNQQFMQPVTSGPQPGAQGWAPQQPPGSSASWGWAGQAQ